MATPKPDWVHEAPVADDDWEELDFPTASSLSLLDGISSIERIT